jgi:hypothetical protein
MDPNRLSPYLPMMRCSPKTMALWIAQKQRASHHGLLQRELSQFVWLASNFRLPDHPDAIREVYYFNESGVFLELDPDRSGVMGFESRSIDQALDFRESAVQMDATARISSLYFAGLRETGTKARLRPEAARVHRR